MVICDLDQKIRHLAKVVLSMFIPASEVMRMDLSTLNEQTLACFPKLDDLNISVGNSCRLAVVAQEEDAAFSSAEFYRYHLISNQYVDLTRWELCFPSPSHEYFLRVQLKNLGKPAVAVSFWHLCLLN